MKLIVVTLFIFIFSCTTNQQYFPLNNPPPLPNCPIIEKPISLSLVLGGGGAKGLAHVGVLEELEKANIPIDLIIGCSAGSIVGALYADCPSTENLKEVLLTLNTNALIDFDIWHARYGLCQGRSLRKFLEKNLEARQFDELKIPFFLVATDLYSSELVTIGGGRIIPAVEASCSIPLIFVPVYLHGRALVDGGVIDPVPVRIANFFNPKVIVAVDLGGLLPLTFPSNLFGVASRSAEITLLWQSEGCLQNADVIIRPELENVSTFASNLNEQIYLAGKKAGREAIPKILEHLQRHGPSTFQNFLPYQERQLNQDEL